MQNNTAVSKHETLVNRLTNMAHLNSEYCLDPAQLAKGYETHLRITRRDFAPFEDCNIPLQKKVKCYLLDPKYLGQLSFKNIRRFSQISGIRHVYLRLYVSFARELLGSRVDDAKGYSV